MAEHVIDASEIWETYSADGPLVATAIHDGHNIRGEVAEIMALNDAERLREEDPFTGEWITVGNTRLKATHSRFQVDLNRPREKAVYINPEDAWGMQVWRTTPSQEIIAGSLAGYDAFYAEVRRIFDGLELQFGKFVVFDLHTYNFRRSGPNGPPDDPELNPEVNIGTGTMNRERWASLVDRFIGDLRSYSFRGRSLDVRENVKFRGGQLSRFVHQTFPESGCSLSIEFKKFFMDEWSGIPDRKQVEDIRLALNYCVPGVLEELHRMGAE